MAHDEKKADFNKFVSSYKLQDNVDIFILPVSSLEEYYPLAWKKTPEEVKQLDIDKRKVSYAKFVAKSITQAEFEWSMSVLYKALEMTQTRAFNPN